MSALVWEGGICLDFSRAVSRPRKFDNGGHGLSHAMKAVDFIAEYHDHFVFLEVKDFRGLEGPTRRACRACSRAACAKKAADWLLDSLVGKFKDSWLFHSCESRVDKPARFYALLEGLDAPMLAWLTGQLEIRLPVTGLPARWRRRLAQKCGVMDIINWNRIIDYIPASLAQ